MAMDALENLLLRWEEFRIAIEMEMANIVRLIVCT